MARPPTAAPRPYGTRAAVTRQGIKARMVPSGRSYPPSRCLAHREGGKSRDRHHTPGLPPRTPRPRGSAPLVFYYPPCSAHAASPSPAPRPGTPQTQGGPCQILYGLPAGAAGTGSAAPRRPGCQENSSPTEPQGQRQTGIRVPTHAARSAFDPGAARIAAVRCGPVGLGARSVCVSDRDDLLPAAGWGLWLVNNCRPGAHQGKVPARRRRLLHRHGPVMHCKPASP
jgi:hypothetical protein